MLHTPTNHTGKVGRHRDLGRKETRKNNQHNLLIYTLHLHTFALTPYHSNQGKTMGNMKRGIGKLELVSTCGPSSFETYNLCSIPGQLHAENNEISVHEILKPKVPNIRKSSCFH